MPPVIKNGLVPRDDGKSAARQGNLGPAATAEVAVEAGTAESVGPVGAGAVEERTVGQPNGERGGLPSGVPAYRVQLARALADAVVGAVDAGDAAGAKVAMGMLEQFVAMMVDKK